MRITLIHALKHSIVPIEASFAGLWPEARLMNLQEMVIGGDITTGPKAVLVHRNELGSSFYLESVAYARDGDRE